MRYTRRGRLTAGIAAIALVAVACGGGETADTDDATESTDDSDDGDEAAGGDIPDAPSDGVESDRFNIGWMGDVTGPTASAQVLNLRGTEAYFDMVNADGGVLGRELNLIVKDDEYGAELGVSNFQELLSDDRVLTIAHLGGSFIVDAVLPDAEREGLPLIVTGQTVNTSLASPYAFHLLGHYFDQADVSVARMLEEVPAEELRVGVAKLEVPSGDEWDVGIQKALDEQGGEYVGNLSISVSAPDAGAFTSTVQQLIDNEGMNYLAIHVAPSSALFVVNTLASAGIDIPVIGMQGAASLNVFAEGDPDQLEVTEGVHSYLTYADDSEGSDEIRAFLDGEGASYVDDAAHINFSAGWLVGMIIHNSLEKAAADAGEITRETFYEALQTAHDTKGLTCPVDWTDGNGNPCAAPFTSDGEQMSIVGDFEQWAEVVSGDYSLAD